ncbi:MAG: hypothetical protein V7744_11850 [Pseudomonadales bacterium]
MSQYELADYANSLLDTFLTEFTIFLTLVTAYIITAFVAGARLTTFQLWIINIVFSISTGIIGMLGFLTFSRFYMHAVIVETPAGSAVIEPLDFSWPIAFLLSALVAGSFIFMWSIRKTKHIS